jgi:drug/metabolite transporter (DMT)-like permease
MTVDEKLSPQKIAGCLIGLLGTAVLIGPRALAGLFTRTAFWILL